MEEIQVGPRKLHRLQTGDVVRLRLITSPDELGPDGLPLDELHNKPGWVLGKIEIASEVDSKTLGQAVVVSLSDPKSGEVGAIGTGDGGMLVGILPLQVDYATASVTGLLGGFYAMEVQGELSDLPNPMEGFVH